MVYRSAVLVLLLVSSISCTKHRQEASDEVGNNEKGGGVFSSALGLVRNTAVAGAVGAARLVNPVISTGSRIVQPAVSTVVEGAKEVAEIATDPRPIFPGTRWCGAGTRAHNESEIGIFDGLDMCCRTHDNCDDNIPAGESKHGLNNTGSFTRSHCHCDDEFYRCLKEDGSIPSKKVGYTYFNVLRPQCFREERKIERCAKSTGIGPTKRCQKYSFMSEEEGKEWQWFDAKEF